jgi:hypothetical protein
MTGTGDLELLVALRHGELARQLRAELGRHNFDDVRRGDGMCCACCTPPRSPCRRWPGGSA